MTGDYATYYQWIDAKSVNELADFVIREIEEGLEGTGIRGGQVKFGTGYNRITALEEKKHCAQLLLHIMKQKHQCIPIQKPGRWGLNK